MHQQARLPSSLIEWVILDDSDDLKTQIGSAETDIKIKYVQLNEKLKLELAEHLTRTATATSLSTWTMMILFS